MVWGNSRTEVCEKVNADRLPDDYATPQDCKSVTFISSTIYDNQALLEKDPGYLANLKGLSLVERERLLLGNWKIRPAAGLYFRRDQVRIVKSVPDKIVSIARAWDLAATEETAANRSPDKTAGVLMARLRNGQYIVLDVRWVAANASTVRSLIKSTAETDAVQYNCHTIWIPQDPGQAGKEQAQSYVKELAGFSVKCKPVSKNKVSRAEPLAAQWQRGNVMLLEGPWNDAYLNELEGFPDALHDDQVDASSDAFAAVSVVNDWSYLVR